MGPRELDGSLDEAAMVNKGGGDGGDGDDTLAAASTNWSWLVVNGAYVIPRFITHCQTG